MYIDVDTWPPRIPSLPPEIPTEEPDRVKVVRWRCHHCGKSWTSRGSARAHMPRCFKNPAVRACLTCEHFNRRPAFFPEDRELALLIEDSCDVDVELPRRRRSGYDAEIGHQQIVANCVAYEPRPGYRADDAT